MGDPKPMDPERLATLREYVASFPVGARGGFHIAEMVNLLAAHDHHAQRADLQTRVADDAHAAYAAVVSAVVTVLGIDTESMEDIGSADGHELMGCHAEDCEPSIARELARRLVDLQPLVEIGRRWNADSSLAQWFPITAERLKDVERERGDAREAWETLREAVCRLLGLDDDAADSLADCEVDVAAELAHRIEGAREDQRKIEALTADFWADGERIRDVEAEVAQLRERAEKAERTRDELARAVANIGVEGVADTDGVFVRLGTAGAVARSAASLMVAAVRLNGAFVKTGICVDVDVDGRTLEVLGQWADAPARTNAVRLHREVERVAALTGVQRGETEQPFAWLERAVGEIQANYRFMVERAADEKLDGYRELGQRAADAERERDEARAEVARLRARVRVDAEDVARSGVTWRHVEAWLRGAGWTKRATASGSVFRPENDTWTKVLIGGIGGPARAANIIADYVKRPSLDIIDEMASMPTGGES